MNFLALWDPTGALIVVGGTFLATWLGSGRHEAGALFVQLRQLGHGPFDFEGKRAEIARDVADIRRVGLLRAGPSHSTDREIVAATKAMVHDRSIRGLIDTHGEYQRRRSETRLLGLRPVWLAAELAPVFGMVGTLFSLSQMRADASQTPQLTAIGLAIVTTLHGLLLAHLLLYPLARLIERRGMAEEAGRQRLIDWLARQIGTGAPMRAATGRPGTVPANELGEAV